MVCLAAASRNQLSVPPGGDRDARSSGLLAIVAAALAYWLVNYSLVVGAILLSAPDAPARNALGDPGEQLIMAAGIGLGVAMAALLAFLSWLVIVLTATVLALHRGLLSQSVADRGQIRCQERFGELGVLVRDSAQGTGNGREAGQCAGGADRA